MTSRLFRYGFGGGLVAGLLAVWILWVTCLRVSCATPSALAAKPGATRVETVSGVVKLPVQIESLLQLPRDYDANPTKQYPLIVFLHGSGERKSPVLDLKKFGPPRQAVLDDLPFIILSPHCPTGKWWTDADMTIAVMEALETVCKTNRVDRDRIVLTGMSMGGFGAWNLAQQYPDTFAALAVVCGSGNPYLMDRVATMPISIYHGARDLNVPLHYAQQMALALSRVGNTARLNIFPHKKHAIWRMVYSDPALYRWLGAQRLSDRTKKTLPATKGLPK